MKPSPYQETLVVRTKLGPPRPPRHTLHRPRLTKRLLEAADYRLTVLQARTGYGKTTALSALAQEAYPVVWYRLSAEDADPLVFILHLIYAFKTRLEDFSELPLALLERWEQNRALSPWSSVVDVMVNELASAGEAVYLVIDDAHHIGDAAGSLRILDRLIGRAPAMLHPIIATRLPLKLPSLVSWRVRGEVLEIGQEELAFNAAEIATLFEQQYDLSLAADQVELISAKIEGWAIALQLVWQRMQSGQGITPEAALGQLSGATGDLFTYLAQEVLAGQPADVQEFLRHTSVLRDMTASLCDCLRSSTDSEQMLRYLLESDLFVVGSSGGHVRYHHLFRDLLRHQMTPDQFRATHLVAAGCFRRAGSDEESLYHYLAGGDVHEAAAILDELGRNMVRAGRLDTLAAWIGALPPEVLQDHPSLLAYLGDIARLHSRFDEALGWYRQAEERSRIMGDVRGVGQALRGQARVYLDTVNPSQAEKLLQEALRLSDGQDDRESRTRLLELLAENLLNRGHSEEAERYQAQARQLREQEPAESELGIRLLLRTGRLDQARNLLEQQVEAERQEPILRPRAHRETLLLLALVLAFQGERDKSFQCALDGTERGKALQSQFITAVGCMRQGHAWLLDKDESGYRQAGLCFREAVRISDLLEVPRLKVEAYWGLCQAAGFQGDLEEAAQLAEKGIQLARAAGDEWVEACIRLTMGASYALAGAHAEASSWLAQAGTAFEECSDRHGEAAARLWQCLVWQRAGDNARLERDLIDLLNLVREGHYEFLFLRKTLLGPPDPRSLVPLLLAARDNGRPNSFAESLLSQLGLDRLVYHPGYQLRIQTLGPLRIWRGQVEIDSREWRRKTARQLFLLLLTQRHNLLDRDQIMEELWQGQEPESAQRDFKIALSALYNLLEPGRARNAPSAYIFRDGSRYGLRGDADIWLDAEQFISLISRGDVLIGRESEAALHCYRLALDLYRGEYLQEYPYEEWCSEERERLLTLYLRTAERLAGALVEREEWAETIVVCQRILERDDCWEQAYRLLMVAYAGSGNRAQALRTYQRCVSRLQEMLAVEPSPATTQLYHTLR